MKKLTRKDGADSKNITKIALITLLILVVPFVATLLSDEVNWNIFDFIIAGALLMSAGLAYEVLVRSMKGKLRKVFAFILLALLVIVWVELAVGIFDTPLSGA